MKISLAILVKINVITGSRYIAGSSQDPTGIIIVFKSNLVSDATVENNRENCGK